MTQARPGEGFALLADIPIDAVRATAAGFLLEGWGGEREEYRLELQFECPVDARTRKVLGELMSQAEVRISRRGGAHPGG